MNSTLTGVKWVAARYGADMVFGGISLLNEPIASRLDLEALNGYYKKRYEAVRRHSACVHLWGFRRGWGVDRMGRS